MSNPTLTIFLACIASYTLIKTAKVIFGRSGKNPKPILVVAGEGLPPDDVCMCGDMMKGHSHPLNCGHSPISMRDYYLGRE